MDRDASDADVKKAFRRLARELHPDVNPGDPDAAERFRETSEAYEALSNPETRARYDRFGHAGVAGTQFHPEQFMDFSNLSDLLGAFFGDDLFGTSRRPSRGGDAAAAVELTLVEAAFGVTREVEVEIISPCDRCDGSGAEPGTTPQTCPTCGGSGHVQHVSNTAFGQFVQTAACAACRGRGRADRRALHGLPRARPPPDAGIGRGADPGGDHVRSAAAAGGPRPRRRVRRRPRRPLRQRRRGARRPLRARGQRHRVGARRPVHARRDRHDDDDRDPGRPPRARGAAGHAARRGAASCAARASPCSAAGAAATTAS